MCVRNHWAEPKIFFISPQVHLDLFSDAQARAWKPKARATKPAQAGPSRACVRASAGLGPGSGF
jgi:hypothetical protein